MDHFTGEPITPPEPWNKGKILGQKRPLKRKDIWGIRIRLEVADKTGDLAMYNLAIDSKLRGCDLLSLRIRDIRHGSHMLTRATITQHKTGLPVQF